MVLARFATALLFVTLATGCNCGPKIVQVGEGCEVDLSRCEVVDSGTPPPPDSGLPEGTCPSGSVTGRVCAPDQRTWLNGATVTVDAKDCNGHDVHVSTVSGADGTFKLDGVPPGNWTAHAALGDFTQDTPVSVTVNQTTAIPENQLCIAQNELKIAVVTGTGDKIETLLSGLTLEYTLFAGEEASWASVAAPFLTDLNRMKQYDLIFFDCAAAHVPNQQKIDLGPQSALIQQNLQTYVAQGGSIYASDWALVFPYYAKPGALDFLMNDGGTLPSPLMTRELMGYAPQTVNAVVVNQELATFLGKTQVAIEFPKETSAISLHWGLLRSVGPSVQVLISAPTAQACTTTDNLCLTPGVTATQVPLAVQLKVTPANARGGRIIYTSFHNVAQDGDDVAKILKYLVLNL